jgi:hypothetical protein
MSDEEMSDCSVYIRIIIIIYTRYNHSPIIIGGTDVLVHSQFVMSDDPNLFDISCDPSQLLCFPRRIWTKSSFLLVSAILSKPTCFMLNIESLSRDMN